MADRGGKICLSRNLAQCVAGDEFTDPVPCDVVFDVSQFGGRLLADATPFSTCRWIHGEVVHHLPSII